MPYRKDSAWVKQRAKISGFLGVRRQLLNNVNTGINFSTVDNGNFSTHTLSK